MVSFLQTGAFEPEPTHSAIPICMTRQCCAQAHVEARTAVKRLCMNMQSLACYNMHSHPYLMYSSIETPERWNRKKYMLRQEVSANATPLILASI